MRKALAGAVVLLSLLLFAQFKWGNGGGYAYARYDQSGTIVPKAASRSPC